MTIISPWALRFKFDIVFATPIVKIGRPVILAIALKVIGGCYHGI
jgi:hypothetical protein